MAITIREIAGLAGCSPTAVSYVLNGKGAGRVRPEKRAAIREAVRKLDYRRNPAARGLKENRLFRVGLCLLQDPEAHPLLGRFSKYEMVTLVSRTLHEHGYSVDLMQFDPSTSLGRIRQSLAAAQCDGIIFLQWEAGLLEKMLFALEATGVRAISLDSRLDDTATWATIDRRDAVYRATSWLLDQGRQQVALMLVQLCPSRVSQDRRDGYVRAMQDHDRVPLPIYAAEPATVRNVTDTTRNLLAKHPDIEGLVITDDIFAPLLMQLLAERHVRLIGIGYGGFADLCDPKLTYMRLPVAEMVNWCTDRMIERIESAVAVPPQHKLFTCNLVVQAT